MSELAETASADDHRELGPPGRGGATKPARARRSARLRLGLLAVWGPGVVVMLADTDAGSLVTAGQSGARWGYGMVVPLVLLIPVLYVVQEMAVRLGAVTGRGHGALIRERFGRRWAVISAGTLFVSAVGALLTEFAGVVGVGQLVGVGPWVSVPLATAFLLGVAATGSYRRVERIGLAVGLAELGFVVAMVLSRPSMVDVAHGLGQASLGDRSYLLLVAANVGAVIMPWMVFYQQGAVIDKGLTSSTIRRARQDTAFGAVLTQLIMIAVVVLAARAASRRGPGSGLSTIADLADTVTPVLGHTVGVAVFAMGMLGASLVAALVSSLAGAWGLAEVFGWEHSLNHRPNRRTAKFYATYAATHILGALLVLLSIDLVRLSLDVEVMNALLLPVVLGFLLLLEARTLPPQWRMRGSRRYLSWAMCGVVIGFGLYMVPALLASA